jgi:undecaprenyl-diphosphatase
MVVVGFLGEEALFESLSRLFHRHRPVFNPPVWEVLPGPGFPSGHTASAIVCYGLLAYLFLPKITNRFWKVVVAIIIALIIIYIGVSRVFVLDHYLSDVLAGYGMGLAWAALAYTTIEKIFQRRVRKEEARAI